MFTFLSLVIMASLLGLAAAVPPDIPGVGSGSDRAAWSFNVTDYGQNTCGNAVYLVNDAKSLSIDDCINLRDSHSNANNTGTYTYTWDAPGDVPAGTHIYGPYNGDCMVVWTPYDYTQSFT